MPLQSEVRMTQAFGVPGEFYDSGPRRVTAYALDTAARIGRACTLGTSEGEIVMGGAGSFAGILMSPKQHTRSGAAGGTDLSGLELPAGTQAEAADMGRVIVTLTTNAEPGDAVVYDTVTGELSAVAAGDAPGSGKKTIPGAFVALFNAQAGGPAVIQL